MDVPEPWSNDSTPPRNKLQGPVDTVRNALRKISSHEQSTSPVKLHNYGNLDDSQMTTVELGASSSRKISQPSRKISVMKSPEEIQLEITQRAEEFQREGVSNPAFHDDQVSPSLSEIY
jgi:hypothetical protein